MCPPTYRSSAAPVCPPRPLCATVCPFRGPCAIRIKMGRVILALAEISEIHTEYKEY